MNICFCKIKMNPATRFPKFKFDHVSLWYYFKHIIFLREMLTTHFLIHIFQYIIFDWLKFTWNPQKVYRTHMIWWDHVNFNQLKKVCWKVCVVSIHFFLNVQSIIASSNSTSKFVLAVSYTTWSSILLLRQNQYNN